MSALALLSKVSVWRGDTGDSEVESSAGGGAEGPHVSYFIDKDQTDAEQQKAKNAATIVADLLNRNLPQGLGPFVIKEHKKVPNQTIFLGVWF